MAYIDQRAEVMVGATDTLTYFAKDLGEAIVIDPGSAWVTVMDPGGNVKQARTQTGVTIDSERIRYSRDWTGYELLEDHVLLVEWAVGGAVFSDRLFFDVVRTKLRCPVTTEDITDLYPDIDKHLASIVQTNAAKFIRRAWSHVIDHLRAGRNRPSLILDRARLINPTLHYAAAFMCMALSKGTDDVWFARKVDHMKEAKSLLSALGEMKYDRDEDGLANEGETKRMNRRPFTV